VYVDLELWLDDRWQVAGRMESLGNPATGYLGKVGLEYDYDYAMGQLGAGGSRALSCRYPPSFELWVEEPWPAFIFDILHAGAARRSMLARLGRPDNREADWELLAQAQFSPGNVRVRPASDAAPAEHEGFDRAEVIERGLEPLEQSVHRDLSGTAG